jgi:hypothetical protein
VILKAIAAVQLVVICVLAVLLFEATRPKPVPSRVETVLADIHGVLSVGANYTQFQEKVQSLSAAIEEDRSAGRGGPALKTFEESLKLYKESLDLWEDTITFPYTYGSDPSYRSAPTGLVVIAKQLGEPITKDSYKAQADWFIKELWQKADEIGRGKQKLGLLGERDEH